MCAKKKGKVHPHPWKQMLSTQKMDSPQRMHSEISFLECYCYCDNQLDSSLASFLITRLSHFNLNLEQTIITMEI